VLQDDSPCCKLFALQCTTSLLLTLPLLLLLLPLLVILTVDNRVHCNAHKFATESAPAAAAVAADLDC
jgi:hypothetical protein